MTDEDTMFSVRETPWHGLGSVLDGYPSRELAMQAAGLNWSVDEAEVWADRPNSFAKVDGWKSLTRSDTGTVLNIARDSYGTIQNAIGFELLEALMEDRAVKLETGGSIGGGATCYVSARIDEAFFVKGDLSTIYPFAVVNWSHDGSASLQGRVTNVRTVCANTLSAGEAEGQKTGRQFSIRHAGNWSERVQEAKALLVGARDGAKAFQELANELANVPVSIFQRKLFVQEFIPAPVGLVVSDQVIDNINTERAKVHALFEGVTIPEQHQGTAYGWLLAGGEYLDHLKGYRNQDTLTKRTLLSHSAFKAKLVPMIQELVNA
jgi:phage/plasmid-like protein (TIGR03299 family)